MSTVINVLHIIPHLFMIKTHANFQDTSKYHHYFVYKYTKPDPLFAFIPNGQTLLTNTVTRFLKINEDFNTHTFSQESFQKIDTFIKNINPKIVFISDPNLIARNLFQHIKNQKLPIFFINHGITNEDVMKQLKQSKKMNTPNWNNYTGVFCTQTEIKEWIQNPRYQLNKNLHFIPGTTCMDSLPDSKQLVNYKKLIYQHIDPNTGKFHNQHSTNSNKPSKLPENTKTILWVQNKNNTYTKSQQLQEFKKIISTIHNNFINNKNQSQRIQLLIKMKHISYVKKVCQSDKTVKTMLSHPQVTFLDSTPNRDLHLYHFLWADAIIIQNYGTSLIEALSVNPHTFRCQFEKRDNQALMKDYPHLIQAFTPEQLTHTLNQFLDPKNKIISPEYQEDRDNFLKQYFFPYIRPQPVCQQILDIALQQITNNKQD